MVHDYDIEVAVKALRAEKLILFPTDTVWSVGCLASSAEAVQRVQQVKRSDSSEDFELLLDSLQMLKGYIPDLHPRLETLLTYHTRPLTIEFNGFTVYPVAGLPSDTPTGIRIVQDAFDLALIEELQEPLYVCSAHVKGDEVPQNFGAISTDILMNVDYVCKYRQSEKSKDQLSVKVVLSDREELVFLRE